MRSLSYFFRFSVAFFNRFKVLIFIGVLAGIAIFTLGGYLLPKIFGQNPERIGFTGRFTTDNIPESILELVSSGLTKISPEGVIEPNIASSWETPDRGKTWIFKIKEGLKWQDGQAIKSQDIDYRFSDVEVEHPDQATIVFKLKDVFSPFPSVVARPVFKEGFLGIGEWRVTKVSLAGTYVQSISLTRQTYVKENKIYKFYPSEERTKLAYKLGHVDKITEIVDSNPLQEWETADISQDIKKNQIVTLFYNNENEIFKDNKELKQALNYAINKDQFSQRAISPIPPFSWVYNPQVKPYNFNVERAKELIKEVQIPEGTEIKLVTSPSLLSVAEKIAKDWEVVGIKAVVQISSVIPTDFQAYLAILDVPKDPDQYAIWHSTQRDSTNISKFVNPRIDKLLEDGRTQLASEERRQIYLDFQRFIVEELPAVFLYHPVTYTITRK